MEMLKMMQQARQVQKTMSKMQKKIEASEAVGSAGDGAVTLRLTGKNKLLAVNIAPQLLQVDQKKMLESLIVAAHNDARDQIESRMADEMKSVSSELNLPPGFKLPF